MNQELQQYLEYIKTSYARWKTQSPTEIRERFIKEFNDTLRYEEGSKYIKVITGTSVHSFIVKKDGPKFKQGDVLKANSWRAPATNFKRGNILSKDYGTIQWTGA
jgi:hypothetical protein